MTTYYQQIKNRVLPRMTGYTTDITTHDKKSLKSYNGEFLHASRTTGTDVALFGKISDLKSLEYADAFCLRESNDLFLHGIYGQVKKITREKASQLIQNHKKHLENKAKKEAA